MSRRFSIVIPTRERSDTLRRTLETVTAIAYDNLQIVVSDNDSRDDTESVVRQFSDSRIQYINTGRRLGMSRNWEFALAHVDGDWVGFIGDDDGLFPDCIMNVNNLIEETGKCAVRSSTCFYQWPVSEDATQASLSIPMKTGFNIRCSNRWLQKLYTGKADYQDLPCIYTGGFVKMSVVRNAMSSDRRFFRSSIPDVYSSVALAKVLDDYVFLYEPLAIAGLSKHSTGRSFFTSTKCDKPHKQFMTESNIPFHAAIPLMADGQPPKSVQAFVYEAYFQSQHMPSRVHPPSPPQQLRVMREIARIGGHDIEEWGKRFASHHGFSYDQAMRGSWAVSAKQLPTRLSNLIKSQLTYRYSNHLGAVRNVSQATKVAAEILRARPSLLQTVMRNVVPTSRRLGSKIATGISRSRAGT